MILSAMAMVGILAATSAQDLPTVTTPTLTTPTLPPITTTPPAAPTTTTPSPSLPPTSGLPLPTTAAPTNTSTAPDNNGSDNRGGGSRGDQSDLSDPSADQDGTNLVGPPSPSGDAGSDASGWLANGPSSNDTRSQAGPAPASSKGKLPGLTALITLAVPLAVLLLRRHS